MQPVNLNLDTLRTFLVSYDLGGYAQAAERLGRTPSAVSVQMKRLQEDAGTNLFRKRGRSVVLTEAGRAAFAVLFRACVRYKVIKAARGLDLDQTRALSFVTKSVERNKSVCTPFLSVSLRVSHAQF